MNNVLMTKRGSKKGHSWCEKTFQKRYTKNMFLTHIFWLHVIICNGLKMTQQKYFRVDLLKAHNFGEKNTSKTFYAHLRIICSHPLRKKSCTHKVSLIDFHNSKNLTIYLNVVSNHLFKFKEDRVYGKRS